MKKIELTIIVPLFNEEKTVLKTLQRINDTKVNDFNYEIIIIDDGSTDKSKQILLENENLYNKLISYKNNMGKGYAVKKGLIEAQGEYVIFQDADLEYDPIDIEKFIEIFKKFKPDCVIGSRFNYDKFSRSHNFYNRVGNNLLTLIFNLFYNTTFTDIYSCYLAFKKDLVEVNQIKTFGWEQHGEILSKVVKKGNKFFEVRISYNGRSIKDGKKIRYYHFFSILKILILERFRK